MGADTCCKGGAKRLGDMGLAEVLPLPRLLADFRAAARSAFCFASASACWATAAQVLSLIIFQSASVSSALAADGRAAYTLNCSGTARGWDKCYKAAGDICQARGYDILDRTSEDTAHVSGNSNGVLGVKTNERSMLIACKH